MTSLFKNKPIKDFIKQFDSSDVPEIRRVISKFRFVSHSELENGLINRIREISKEVSSKIALFPIHKNTSIKLKSGKVIERDGIDRKIDYESSYLIGTILRKLEKQNKGKFVVSPTKKSIKAEGISHAILVDDILASGERTLNSWVKDPIEEFKSLKSLHSFGKLKITFLYYAICNEGLRNVVEKSSWKKDQFKSCLNIENQYHCLTDAHDTLFNKYICKFKLPEFLGYRDFYLPIIFQHCCPNSLPSIFYVEKAKWKPLFPNRAIPIELHNIFMDKEKFRERIQNELADLNFGKIATGLILDGKRDFENTYLIPVMALVSRGYGFPKIAKILLLDTIELSLLFSRLNLTNLIDEKNNITEHGRLFLQSIKENTLQKIDNLFEDECAKKRRKLYIPNQFMGEVAKV